MGAWYRPGVLGRRTELAFPVGGDLARQQARGSPTAPSFPVKFSNFQIWEPAFFWAPGHPGTQVMKMTRPFSLLFEMDVSRKSL